MVATTSSVVKSGDEPKGFLGRLPWYYQMGLLIALDVVLFFAMDQLLFSDRRAQTAKILEQVQSLRAKNAQGSIIRQNIAAAEQTLKAKREEIEQLRELLPDQVEISRVFDNIKDFVKTQKLELKRFSEIKESPAEFYTAQPIQVEVTGTYDNLGHFFSQLGFYKRIVSVTDVEIKQAPDSAQEVGRSIDSSFIVTVYYVSPENLEKLTSKKPESPKQAPTKPAK
jgi:type IV pilus assembly protein PilO